MPPRRNGIWPSLRVLIRGGRLHSSSEVTGCNCRLRDWRSAVTKESFAVVAAHHRLRTLRHDDAWGLAGRYNMRFNSDCISTIEKRLIKHNKITLNSLSQLSREILFASEVLCACSGALRNPIEGSL